MGAALVDRFQAELAAALVDWRTLVLLSHEAGNSRSPEPTVLQTSGDKTVTSVNVKAKNHSGTYWT